MDRDKVIANLREVFVEAGAVIDESEDEALHDAAGIVDLCIEHGRELERQHQAYESRLRARAAWLRSAQQEFMLAINSDFSKWYLAITLIVSAVFGVFAGTAPGIGMAMVVTAFALTAYRNFRIRLRKAERTLREASESAKEWTELEEEREHARRMLQVAWAKYEWL